MKYTDTTEEQRKSITPILKKWFEKRNYWQDHSKEIYKIEAFQQAQKEIYESLDKMYLQFYDEWSSQGQIEDLKDKLKFESELE